MPITITATTDSDPEDLLALGEFFTKVGNEQLKRSPRIYGTVQQFGRGERKVQEPSVDVASLHIVSDTAPLHIEPVLDRREENLDAAAVFQQPDPSSIPVQVHSIPSAPGLDSKGLPWDDRIHGSGKTTNVDGTWRAKRGVDPELVKAVEAELRGAVAAPVIVPPPPNVPPPPSIEPPPIPHAPAAAVPSLAPLVPPPAPGVPTTFAELTGKIAPRIADGSLRMEVVLAACLKFGVPSLPSLHSLPALIPQVYAELFDHV